MALLTTPAILLRRFDHGESAQVAWLLTPRQGRVAAFAAGARRSRRRFPGGIEPATLVTAVIEPPRRGELWRLSELSPRALLPSLRGSLEAIACAGAACELSAELSRENDPAPGLFVLLEGYLRLLDGGRRGAADLAGFFLDALGAAGLGPSLSRCARCGGAREGEDDPLFFDGSEGGCLCRRCPPRAPGAVPVRAEWVDALVRAGRGEAPELPPGAQRLLWQILDHRLGKRLRSHALLAQLRLA